MHCEECGRRLAAGEVDICTKCEEREQRFEREHAYTDEDIED